jgi:flavin-dependent dehydrogenase
MATLSRAKTFPERSGHSQKGKRMESLKTDLKKVDVVVVGAGPAGSAAGKRCAECGLETVIFERKELPRDKVCSGVIVGLTAQRLVKEEFGGIPKDVLADPYYYCGTIIHVPGVKPLSIESEMPVGWRRDIDFWLTQKARAAGAQVWDRCQIKRVEPGEDEITVTFFKDGEEFSVKASYVIGADGVRSLVRRMIFPELNVRYQQEIRECYEGSFPLDRNYYHGFYIPGKFWFDINHKGPYFCLEVSAKPGEIKGRVVQAKEILQRQYDFDPSTKPLWRDACMEPRIHEQLISGAFRPAKGKILLTGDAAGFQLPNSEGIGTALLSGLMAGESIFDTVKQGGQVDGRYLQRVKQIIDTIEKQFIMAANSRYLNTNVNLEEIAEKICSFLTESTS